MGGRIPPKIITDYQSANEGTVAEKTQPDTIQTVVETATRLISNPPGTFIFNNSFELPSENTITGVPVT